MRDHKPFGELSDAEKGALLLAHLNGKRIEYYNEGDDEWSEPAGGPKWVKGTIYRIAPDPLIQDSIDWEHVAPEWKFMARNDEGNAYLFNWEPMRRTGSNGWVMHAFTTVRAFASYRRGTVDWKDSLVRRPS